MDKNILINNLWLKNSLKLAFLALLLLVSLVQKGKVTLTRQEAWKGRKTQGSRGQERQEAKTTG